MQNLQELFVEQLRDIYDAENQLMKALPKMADAASSNDLKQAFQMHLDQTKQHVQRLEQVFDQMGMKAQGKTCEAMKGLVKEGEEVIDKRGDSDVKDAALIAAAQRVEHYEIAAYGTVSTYAQQLGENDVQRLLEQTLSEEKQTDTKLTELAVSSINRKAETDSSRSNR
ncbi:MAG: ferritin-like domain-containing protein [Anaerolineae bacterium]